MVVENTRDLAAYEKTGKYEGVYHVLHGAISVSYTHLSPLSARCFKTSGRVPLVSSLTGYPRACISQIKSSRSEARVGSPPEIQTPSRIPRRFFRKESISSSGITGSSAGCSTRELFWPVSYTHLIGNLLTEKSSKQQEVQNLVASTSDNINSYVNQIKIGRAHV